MVPGLEERLVGGTDADVAVIAEMVKHEQYALAGLCSSFLSYERGCRVLDQMTQKV
jgi:hypothetical protein